MKQEAKPAEPEEFVFPPVPDDQVWCSLRGELVGVTTCATDACIAPEARPVCWLGRDAFLVRVEP